MKLFFILHVVYFRKAMKNISLIMVKFRNWPEFSEEQKFSCSHQNVSAFLENATIAIYFSFCFVKYQS